jgi:large subunit ribosomal protein L25
MTDTVKFNTELRENAGKGAARAVRRAGRVPAVIYGDKKEPVMISLDPREVHKELCKGSFFTMIFELEAGKKKERAIAKDIQFHPVTDSPLHIDFLRVSAKTTVNVSIPIEFVNEEESAGLKRGGVLNIVHHEVEVVCRADAIPHILTIDLTGTDIGHAFHLNAIKLSDGVEFASKDDGYTIATLLAPRVSVDEDETDAADGIEEASSEEETSEA